MRGTTARETRKTLLRLLSRTWSQSFSDLSCRGPKPGLPIPALLTRRAMGPSFSSVACTRAAMSRELVTSADCARTPSVMERRAEAADARVLESRAQMEMEAPRPASFRAMAFPIPRLPPVIRATRPERGFSTAISDVSDMEIPPYRKVEFYAKLNILPRMPPDFGSFRGTPERDGETQNVGVCTEVASTSLRSDLRWNSGCTYNFGGSESVILFLQCKRREDWPASQRAASLYQVKENRKIRGRSEEIKE